MNLHQRINAVRKAIAYIQKDKSVSTGGGSYKAVTHDQVTAIVRSHLVEHGIVCVPSLVESAFHLPLVGTDGTTAKQRLYEATYDFAFINIEDPNDKLVIRMQAHAMDNADKAPGKALSYAKKYAVLKLFELETGEDEESRYAEHKMDEELAAQMLSAVSGAQTMDELVSEYRSSYRAAEMAKDEDLKRSIIAAKDARKAALSGDK